MKWRHEWERKALTSTKHLCYVLCLIHLIILSGSAECTISLDRYVFELGYKPQLMGNTGIDLPFTVCILDERTGKFDFVQEFSAGTSLSYVNLALNTALLCSGEKRIIISAEKHEIYNAEFFILGNSQRQRNQNAMCELLIPGETTLWDTNGKSHTEYRIADNGFEIAVPEGTENGTVILKWGILPEYWSATIYGNNIEKSIEFSAPRYVDSLTFGSETRRIRFETRGRSTVLASIDIYTSDDPPVSAQIWQNAPDELDILFISTHQDDEFLFFGGAIPYYNAIGKKVGIVYAADCGLMRCNEALDALWVSGQRYYPFFLGYTDMKLTTLADSRMLWEHEGDITGDLVRLIRKYKPKIVVTQDFNGEYGHFQHILTVQCANDAIRIAADPSAYPDTASEYGIWEVLKFYSHLYPENSICIDWNQPLPNRNGITSLELAKVAFDRNRSQASALSMELDGVRYDNRMFGLVSSHVGEDILKNSFFENIESCTTG